MWAYVVMVLLFILIGVFIFLKIKTDSKNKINATYNILYPFSGYLAPPGQWGLGKSKQNPGTQNSPQDGLFLVGQVGGNSNNVPQIQCPEIDGVKYKINIVGAFVEVVDPYGECSLTPDPTLQLTCGNRNQVSFDLCTIDSDCSSGTECSGGKCIPKKCSSSNDCSDGTIPACNTTFLDKTCSTNDDCGGLLCINGKCQLSPGGGSCMECVDPDGKQFSGTDAGGVCSFMPTCEGVGTDGKNRICSVDTDKYKCRPREATAYLAKHCDGLSSCLGNALDIWKPNVTGSGNPFGPLPCELAATDITSQTGKNDYLGLPIISGWGGGTPMPSDGGTGSNDPVTLNQGYYVHGIYTCVPETENVQSS